MVQSGLGVAVVPALTAETSPGHGFRVGLYRTSLRDRRMRALLPEQYARIEPHRTFLDALKEAGRGLELPAIQEAPFLSGAGGKPKARRRKAA